MFSESSGSDGNKSRVKVKRKAHFNAAHRLHVEPWTEKKNTEVFGKCNNEFYHGHNYKLEVEVEGEVDPVSGMVIDMKELAQIIDDEIVLPWDHKNLNLQVEVFKTLNPTAENMAIVAYHKIKSRLKEGLNLKVILHETERNSVEYEGK